MDNLQMYYSRSLLIIAVLYLSIIQVFGQGNCLLYDVDSGERLACELSYRAIQYKQGSKNSQVLFDAANKIGPKYAYAYYERSVPYFKRGLFSEGIALLNKAVELEPVNYLYYRAYWYFSMRSYEKCIEDLERYYYQLNGFARTTPGGDMEMRMLLGMAYTQVERTEDAVKVVEEGIDGYEAEGFFIGPYTYHVLGLTYAKNNQFEPAKSAFEKQIEAHPAFADSYYYLSYVQKKLGNRPASIQLIDEAIDRFQGLKNGYSFVGFDVFNVNLQNAIDAKNKLLNAQTEG